MKKILSAAFFSVGCIAVVPLYADNASGMPDWSEPTRTGAFDANGDGKVSFSFSSSGGTKTGPGGTATYSFNIPKGNVVSVSVSADDSATVSVPAANVSASSRWDASQKKIVPGEATSVFVDTDEISGDTIPVTITYTNAGGPYSLSFTVFVERVKADVSTVNISAPSKLVLSQDDGTPFDGNDWVKNRSRNGTLRESNPISVTSGNVLTFVPSFEIIEDTLPENVRAEFSVPGSTAVSQIKDYASISSGIELPAPVAAGNIDYFDNSLTVTWSVQYSGCDKWFPAGTSSHEIYFTRTAPGTDLRQEILFWVSCTGGKGKSSTSTIADGIYEVFQTRAIHKKSNGAVLSYWEGGISDAIDAVDLIDFGNGNCEAWCDFFCHALQLQGVSATASAIIPIVSGEILLLRTWEFSLAPLSIPDFPNYEYVVAEKESTPIEDGRARPQMSLPAQGNYGEMTRFDAHYIVLAEGCLYDPSYGLNKVNNRASGLILYESTAFSGYGFPCTIGGEGSLLIRKEKPNDVDTCIYDSEVSSLNVRGTEVSVQAQISLSPQPMSAESNPLWDVRKGRAPRFKVVAAENAQSLMGNGKASIAAGFSNDTIVIVEDVAVLQLLRAAAEAYEIASSQKNRPFRRISAIQADSSVSEIFSVHRKTAVTDSDYPPDRFAEDERFFYIWTSDRPDAYAYRKSDSARFFIAPYVRFEKAKDGASSANNE